MDDARREMVRAWLIKARNDLDAARQLGSHPEGHLDTAIYHCQQAAEKAVKGFLAFNDHRPVRTHDMEPLVVLACGYETGFATWKPAAAMLTPYATAYRYPDESAVLEPSREEFEAALKLAGDFVAFVSSRLPPEVHP